jgi:hypothetical protein
MLDHWFSHLFAEDARDLHIVDSVDLGHYDFDDVTVVKNRHGYHVVSTSHEEMAQYDDVVSTSHEEMAQYDAGPFATYEEALRYVPKEHREHFAQTEPSNAPR